MTLSIAARCVNTGMLGAAISSSSICVASRCVWAQARVGVVLTQNVTNPALGPRGLEWMTSGLSAPAALAQLLKDEPHPAYRQLVLLDQRGNKVHFSGEKCLGRHAHDEGEHCLAAGNLLANHQVPQAMVTAFETSNGHLAERLLTALSAGLAAGAEAGPLHSAAVVVVDEQPWPLVDLRVDWAGDDGPIDRLHDLWRQYRPQMQDYVTRALAPEAAPSFGVSGDV